MDFYRLEDLEVSEKKVLVRVDFNVPIDKKGNVLDDKRIRAALPTINYLLKKKAMIILCTHLGRPDGKIAKELRLDNVAKRLEKLLKKKVYKLDDCIGNDVVDFVDKMIPGEIVLLENLRFYKEEEENNEDFASSLADLADLYVQEAFGTVHRAHASVVGVTKYLKSAAGYLLQKEIEMLSKAMKKPKKPFVAIMAGKKVSDKIKVIKNLLKKVDHLLIGGAMMFAFYQAKGYSTGDSYVEKEGIPYAKKLLKNKKIILPTDVVVADKLDNNSRSKTVKADKIPEKWIGLDIGPESIKLFSKYLKPAKTIIWNGPLGMTEFKKYAKGSIEIAKVVSKNKGLKVAGGGETAAFLEKGKYKMTHLSTGGGASLEFFEGKKLPGLAALEKNHKKF